MDDFIYELAQKNELKLARFGKRFFAVIIDLILMSIILFFIFSDAVKKSNLTQDELNIIHSIINSNPQVLQTGYIENNINNQSIIAMNKFFGIISKVANYFLLIYFVYNFAFIRFYGATIGKIICKIRVVSYTDLGNPSTFNSIKRALSKTFCDTFFMPFGMIGYALFFYGRTKRDLNDMFSRTIVIENTIK